MDGWNLTAPPLFVFFLDYKKGALRLEPPLSTEASVFLCHLL